MDVRELIQIVQQAETEQQSFYQLAAAIVAAQKEADALLAETLGATTVASVIRQST